MPAQDLHSCSWFCEQPLCVLAQRDELRERMVDLGRDAARYRWAIARSEGSQMGRQIEAQYETHCAIENARDKR